MRRRNTPFKILQLRYPSIWFWVLLALFAPSHLLAQDPPVRTAPILETVSITETFDSTFADKDSITIAIVQDGPSWIYDRLIKEVEAELTKLIGGEKKIVFKKKGYNANWNAKAIPGVLGKALFDPEVDIVFIIGILATQAAASPILFLEKPVVASLISRSEILTLPITDAGKSRKKNFTFVVLNLSISRDFEAFQEMIPAKTISVLVDGNILGNLKGIQQGIAELEKSLGVKMTMVKGSSQAEEFLKQLGPETEAVMITILPRMSQEQRQILIDGINRKKIPSFSFLGYPDVEKNGVLAALVPETFKRTARRAALDIQQIILGFAATDLSVMMPIEARLLINGKTAQKVGYSPDFITLRTANITDHEPLQEGPPLDLDKAIQMAGGRNIDIKISQAETKVAKQESLIQRSFLLPQANSSILYTQIDRDRSLASLGALPQKRTTGNLAFSQVVFDDVLWANFRASRRDADATRYQERSTELNSMLDGGQRFVELLATLALLRIEAQNLSLTQDNLSMARLRFEVGMSGLDEVYRWESQEAQQRGAVFQRAAAVSSALVALNQSLNMDQAMIWNPKDIPVDEAENYLFDGQLKEVLNTVKQFDIFSEFLVEASFLNSPVLKAFGKQVQGQSIRLNQRKRRFYTPSFGTTFDYSREFQKTNPGAIVPAQQDKDDWIFNGGMTLPIFQGGLRAHDMNQAKANLMRINGEKIRAMQLIEQQTRTILNDVSASSPNIYFTRRAADRAKLNLGIVSEKYSQGTVGILDLLDAQSEYITLEQEAALAVYQFVLDLLEVQRAISWFEVDQSSEQVQQFLQEIKGYMKHGGRLPETMPQVLETNSSGEGANP